MLRVGFEPIIQVFEGTKTFHASDHAAIGIGTDAVESEILKAP
jgi:hypothetical protein